MLHWEYLWWYNTLYPIATGVAFFMTQPPIVFTQLDRRVIAVCDAVGAFIGYWGFKEVLGKIWTLMALHKEPLTQIEISRRLEISRSLVSESMAILQDLGLVRACGSHRNTPYEAVLNVWPTISDVLRSREWALIEQAKMALEGLQEEMNLNQPEASIYDASRVRILLAMTELAQAFLRIIIALRKPQSVVQMPGWVRKAGKLVREFTNI